VTRRWRHARDERIDLTQTDNGRAFDPPITKVHPEILKPLRHM